MSLERHNQSPQRRVASQVAEAVPVSIDAVSSELWRQFDDWLAERADLHSALEVTPGTDVRAREKILDRYFEVEQLILNTPCIDRRAIRAKATLVLSYMEIERADGVQAMREIKAYFDGIN